MMLRSPPQELMDEEEMMDEEEEYDEAEEYGLENKLAFAIADQVSF